MTFCTPADRRSSKTDDKHSFHVSRMQPQPHLMYEMREKIVKEEVRLILV